MSFDQDNFAIPGMMPLPREPRVSMSRPNGGIVVPLVELPPGTQQPDIKVCIETLDGRVLLEERNGLHMIPRQTASADVVELVLDGEAIGLKPGFYNVRWLVNSVENHALISVADSPFNPRARRERGTIQDLRDQLPAPVVTPSVTSIGVSSCSTGLTGGLPALDGFSTVRLQPNVIRAARDSSGVLGWYVLLAGEFVDEPGNIQPLDYSSSNRKFWQQTL